jgi:hypothetical protein
MYGKGEKYEEQRYSGFDLFHVPFRTSVNAPIMTLRP